MSLDFQELYSGPCPAGMNFICCSARGLSRGKFLVFLPLLLQGTSVATFFHCFLSGSLELLLKIFRGAECAFVLTF